MAERNIELDGQQRRYLLSAPAHEGPMPLVLVFHGSGEEADSFTRRIEILTLATEQHFAVASLEGPVRDINHVNVSWDTSAPPSTNVDMKFALAVIKNVDREVPIDRTRVWALGYSQGAYFSFIFAFTHADVISGIALQEGASPVSRAQTDQLIRAAARKPPVYLLVGADDEVSLAHQTRDALLAAGVTVKHEEPARTGHLYIPEKTAEMISFLFAHRAP